MLLLHVPEVWVCQKNKKVNVLALAIEDKEKKVKLKVNDKQHLKLSTEKEKKAVFIFSVIASIFFNVLLFSSLGENLLIRFVFSLVGIGSVFFQTVQLRIFYNTKKSKRFMNLFFYLFATILSFIGTIGGGFSQIEKTKILNADKEARLKVINKKLLLIESSEKNDILKERLKTLQTKARLITNEAAYWNSVYDKKIAAISRQLFENEKEISNMEALEIEKANILKLQKNIINSISGISKLFNIKEGRATLILLIMAAIVIELMVFGSADFNGKLIVFKNSKKVKKKKDDQLRFNIVNGNKI